MKELNRTQLKIIAICAMVCDHLAWGFLDFYTPLAQILHIIGRLTIPIMCFFIAEGYRHTANLRRYIHRMICFWLISVLPFYLFFGDMYEYRQNIIFDLLLGLCTLTVLNASALKKWQKVLLTAAIFFISATVGGWPIMPILFILVFYYVKDFKKQALWICSLTVLLVVFLAVTGSLNQTYHFCHYSWMWYDRLYMLGFMLPLVFLKHYNKEKGQTPFTSYFFYIFYPVHFLVLYLTQQLIAGVSIQQIYTFMQLAALFLLLGILVKVALVKPSKAQMATLMVTFSAIIYTFGFLIEITTISTAVYFAAIKMEYLGEVMLITAFTLFIKELCHRKVPVFVYIFELLVGTVTLWCIFTVEQNHFFYRSIGRDTSGPFPRLTLTYNTGFYLFAIYLAIYCIAGILLCLHTAKNCIGVERKRLHCCICGIICPWIPMLLRSLGLTGGYEIPSVGIVGSAWFICLALLKYGFFDSVTLAGESALRHGNEGILVINTNLQIVYANHFIQELFGHLTEYSNVKDFPVLQDIFAKKKKTLTVNDKVYEMRLEPLMESGYLQGYMLWAINMTEHYKHLMKIEDIAKKDALTGIYNRNVFESELTYYLDNSGSGAMFMLDLDNFKQVNDTYGHQTGDDVLCRFGQILTSLSEDACFACRIGGDEFCLFFKQITDPKELAGIARKIIADFKESLSHTKYADVTAVSIGIAICKPAENEPAISYAKLYSRADRALYISKNNGKNTWHFYS